jgi:cytochrome c biogenesis protein CcdA
MGAIWLAAGMAFWLGLLTSVSPCPLATNIAAVSFVGRSVGSPARVLISGLLYALGRMAAYVGIAALLVVGALSIPALSSFLQGFMNRILGPVLILVGMVLLDLLTVPMPGGGWGQKLGGRAGRWGLAGSALLGFLFALAFCPVSAALYFKMIADALAHRSALLLPALYGAGTAVPVVAFSIVLAVSAQRIGAAYNAVGRIETWARGATGVAFVLVGIYYSLVYIYGVLG